MGGMGRDALVGRDAELGRVRGAVEAVRTGTPTTVLVVGEAGVGKSSLLTEALATAGAHGDVVVTASGDEFESDLDYGILDQLRRGFPPEANPGMPLEPAPNADPRRVGAALLRLIDAVSLDGPLIVVVDDAQWADRASLEALTFGARRLSEGATVLLAVAVRPDGLDRLPPGLIELAEEGGRRLDLEPLGPVAVARLAERHYGRPLPAPAAARLYHHTVGNPLHTNTLLDDLPFEAMIRPGDLPAPRSYAGLVLSRLADSSADAQALLSALAVLGARAPLADAAATAGLAEPAAASRTGVAPGGANDAAGLSDAAAASGTGAGPEAPAAAPDAGLARAVAAAEELAGRGLAVLVENGQGPVLAFPHGLVQASVAADLSPSRRVALHLAAARVTQGEEALRHRLAAAHGPDAELVAEARALAERRAAAGAHGGAARILLDAAPVASSPPERERLVADAAVQLVVAGQPLGPLAAEVAGFPDSAPRSYVLGRLAMARGSVVEAEQFLTHAWEQATTGPDADDGPSALAGPAADLLAILSVHRRRPGDATTWARRALDAGGDSASSATTLCHGLGMAGEIAEAEAQMSELLATETRPAILLDARLGRGVTRMWADDLEGARADLLEVLSQADEHGSFLAEANVRCFLAELDFRAGRWEDALDVAEGAASVVDDAAEAWLEALPHGVAATVLAGRGKVDEARPHARAATASADATGMTGARLWSLHSWLRIAAAQADHAEVAAIGDRLVAEGWDAVPEGVHRWRAGYVESLVAVGRLDDADAAVSALADQAARAPGDVALATDLARARGAVAVAQGDQEAAEVAFESGLALEGGDARPFERGRLELAAAAHQRRTGRRRAAADLLARAGDRFEALGAAPWSELCAREVERCGLRPRSRSEARDADLTAQERLVARLVATGLTNREVAAELVISAKTVEHHLGRVYTKLGLRSRTELAAHLAPALV
jgi:DNA-binding CsgD family transcriptional regulator